METVLLYDRCIITAFLRLDYSAAWTELGSYGDNWNDWRASQLGLKAGLGCDECWLVQRRLRQAGWWFGGLGLGLFASHPWRFRILL